MSRAPDVAGWAALLALLLAAVLPAQQTNPNAPSDPFAVLAAKEAQEPAAGGMRVVVQKPDGTPATDAIVVFTPWRDDEARLLLPRDGHDVVVEATDGTVRRLLGVTDDQVIVLGNGAPLTVQLSPPPKLPGGVALELACDEQKVASFDASGIATVVLPKAGSYQPTLRVRGPHSTFVFAGLNLAALDVPATGGKFVLELTAEQQRTLANGIEHVMAR